jgi:ubiquitin carboxyl-terminal hydrolase 7
MQEVFQVLVPKNGVIADLFPLIQKKANLDDDALNNIRIYEAHAGKIYKELDDNFSVAGVNEFVVLYAEILPEEERNAGEGDRSIYAFHFDKEPNKTHGVPFKFVVKPVSLDGNEKTHMTNDVQGEVFKDTKERLSKRTGIKGKQFEKIKFTIVHRTAYHKPTVLEDGTSPAPI